MNCIAKWDFHVDCEDGLQQALTGLAPESLDQTGRNFLNRVSQHETECGCSPKAVASIIVQLNSSKDQVKIEVDKAKAEAAAQTQFKLAELQATTDAEKKILSASIVAKEKEIAALNEEIRKQSSSSSNPMLWAAGGFAGGAVFTVLTVFALSHATK